MEFGDVFLQKTLRRPADDRVLQVRDMGSLVLCKNQEGPRTRGVRVSLLLQGILKQTDPSFQV